MFVSLVRGSARSRKVLRFSTMACTIPYAAPPGSVVLGAVGACGLLRHPHSWLAWVKNRANVIMTRKNLLARFAYPYRFLPSRPGRRGLKFHVTTVSPQILATRGSRGNT